MIFTGHSKTRAKISAVVIKDGVRIPLGQIAGKGRGIVLRWKQWKLRRKLRQGKL